MHTPSPKWTHLDPGLLALSVADIFQARELDLMSEKKQFCMR